MTRQLSSGQVKIIDLVFRIDSWRSATVSMRVDDTALDDSAYQWQLTRSDLITWVDLEIEEERKFEIIP